jgi:hypothetical protein
MEDIAMHFCLTGQYTPQALNSIMDNPTVSRYEAAKNLIEAAGGKLISMYSTATDGAGDFWRCAINRCYAQCKAHASVDAGRNHASSEKGN